MAALVLDAQGWVSPAQHLPSPNCDERPAGTAIELLVIHCISLPAGTYGGAAIDALFTNRLDPSAHPDFAGLEQLRVAAHFVIRRDGALTQYVACGRRAWHAGVSAFEGRARCNDFSIGIELEGIDSEAFTEAQYATLIDLGKTLIRHYPLVAVAAHSEIAPMRKTDPGPHFDWRRIERAWPELRRPSSPSPQSAL